MKTRKSILDPHAEKLAEWDAQNVALAEMQTRLAGLGCAVSLGRLSGFLSAQRQQRLMATVLGNVATGAQQQREIEQAFAKNPGPQIATLVDFIKRLILDLQIKGSTDPQLLEAANALFKSLMDFLKVEQKGKELELNREKFKREDDAFLERLLKRAAEINSANVSNAEKIAAMRQAAFADVDALQASGTVAIPK